MTSTDLIDLSVDMTQRIDFVLDEIMTTNTDVNHPHKMTSKHCEYSGHNISNKELLKQTALINMNDRSLGTGGGDLTTKDSRGSETSRLWEKGKTAFELGRLRKEGH